jgi:hypothetical protein
VHWEHVNYIDYVCSQQREKINWGNLSHNPQAISLLDQPLAKIDWGTSLPKVQDTLLHRASVRNKIIYQELMEKALHPSRVLKWISLEDDDEF